MEVSAQELAFGVEVARCRAVAGVTQEWVAQRVGLARSKISEIGAGRYLPSWPVLDALITALGMDRARTVGLWRAAQDGRSNRLLAERAADHPRPAGWAELPVLPPEVAGLLRAQQRMAQELPYRLPGARRLSLAMVYVRQALGGSTEEPPGDPARPVPMLDGRGILHVPAQRRWRSVVRPPSRPVQEVLDQHEHLLVTGGPGQGKSTLSLHLSAGLADAWLARECDRLAPLSEPVVPLRLTARELAARLELPFGQALAAGIRALYGALLATEVDRRVLVGRVAGCRWLLLVDGLDEIADGDRRDRLVTVLTDWADRSESPYRILLTTRPVDSAALIPLDRLAAKYELQPFDGQELRRFAEQWFAKEGVEVAQRFLHQIHRAYLDELVRVPLLATIAAIVFTEHSDRALPDNQYELYEAYLRFLRTGRAGTPTRFDRVQEALLEHLGRVRLELDTSLITAARDWVAERTELDRAVGWDEELTNFLTTAGPLVRRGADVQFLHHSFAEHLAATAAARRLPEAFDPEHSGFAGLLHAACQEERGRYARTVLLHYCRVRPEQADRLLRWLHGRHAASHVLAARLLAQHLPASAAAIDLFLATARAWAMTTQFPSRMILGQVGRATHHPGLARWLAGLAHDPGAPWSSRIDAAAALATRLRGEHSERAAELLCMIVRDTRLAVVHRVTAAESLTECDGADRDVAVGELGALLADPALPADRIRGAAVVLAGLGPHAREGAATFLSRSLQAPDTPIRDLVELATGLAEIGHEFHARCAEILKFIMCDHGCAPKDRMGAAIGLAAVAPQHQASALGALTSLVTDRALDIYERASAAEAMMELGLQYRPVAGRLLLDILSESGIVGYQRWHVAAVLANLGPEFHAQVVSHLRAVIADRRAGGNAIYWAIASLVKLGPELHAEATTALDRFAADPLVDGFEHAYALGQLAQLGRPHRAAAVARLHAEMCDDDAGAATRIWAAEQLVWLGPEFHQDANLAFLAVVAGNQDPAARLDAWSNLAALDARYRAVADDAMLTALRSVEVSNSTLRSAASRFVSMGAAGQQHVSKSLFEIIANRTRCCEVRIAAVRVLVELGRPFHGAALSGFAAILGPAEKYGWNFELAIDEFRSLGVGLRGELKTILVERMSDPDLQPEQAGRIARALMRLGVRTSEVTDALRAATADEAAGTFRCEAAVVLAQLEPGSLPDAVGVWRDVASSALSGSGWWQTWLLNLGRYGADVVVRRARELLADVDVSRSARVAAAAALTGLDANHVGTALVELRQQAADVYLDLSERVDVLTLIADLDPRTLPEALAFHQGLLDDAEQPMDVRVEAADQLVRLDRSRWPATATTLRRLAATSYSRPVDHVRAIEALARLKMLRPAEIAQHALAVVHHPAAPPSVRRKAIGIVPRHLRANEQRSMLDDYSAGIVMRVPLVDTGETPLLPTETEYAIREVLTAVETGPGERVEAAEALAQLSPLFLAEAMQALTVLAHASGQASVRAKAALGRFSGRWRRRLIDSAERIVANDQRPLREHYRALDLLDQIALTTTPARLNALRAIASAERSAGRRRVDALVVLRRVDGLDPLRTLRDNPHAAPATRWRAAMHLTGYTPDDRAAAAHLLHKIATSADLPPALRWRTARDLATLGPRGRDQAIATLRTISSDPDLPVLARANGARELATIRPASRPEALTTVQGLTELGGPLHRVQVWLAIATLDATVAVPALRAMTCDRALNPLVRLRSAQALARLRRDHQETAALLARELMHDSTVAHHTRSTAARYLARWSAPCRQEARDWLCTNYIGASS